jgi:hypothetical protein
MLNEDVVDVSVKFCTVLVLRVTLGATGLKV